jgi:hypothetical protein
MDAQALLEQFAAVAATLAGVFLAFDKTKGAITNLFNAKPLRRSSVKADLELLKLMDEDDPGYKELKAHIKSQVLSLTKVDDERSELVTGRLPQILIGLAMAGGFSYWTYRIITSDISNWWTILTIWLAMAGFGFLITPLSKKKTSDS